MKFTELAFAGIVIEAGTWAAAMLLAKFTTTPAAGATLVNVTVPVRDAPPIADEGITVTEERALTAGAGL